MNVGCIKKQKNTGHVHQISLADGIYMKYSSRVLFYVKIRDL